MKCKRCIELRAVHLLPSFYPVRMVPLTGRAATNGLCCKHDREINGKQSEEEKGNKQKQIEARRQARRNA